MPRVVAESSSEAVFIASRLLEQEQQLAKHAAEVGEGPILAGTHVDDTEHSEPSEHAGAASAAADSTSAGEDTAEHEDAEWSNGSAEEAAPEEGAAAAATVAAGNAKAKFKLLCPIIVTRMAGKRLLAVSASGQLPEFTALKCMPWLRACVHAVQCQ